MFGGGSFGTAMAAMLARNKEDMDVCLLVRDEGTLNSINLHHKNRYVGL